MEEISLLKLNYDERINSLLIRNGQLEEELLNIKNNLFVKKGKDYMKKKKSKSMRQIFDEDKSIKLNNPLDSCRLLVKKAKEILNKASSHIDDITVITIKKYFILIIIIMGKMSGT